ncbi:MAG: hypothetical protein PHO83_04715 [Geobacteraceae bacterium]|nr:hypothetical protein [Geobacteraceae bacterium]
MELVRYIHLNPLRARIVRDLETLDTYPYAGHSILMGKQKIGWQSTASVLPLFGSKLTHARSKYHDAIRNQEENCHAEVCQSGHCPRYIHPTIVVRLRRQLLKSSPYCPEHETTVLGYIVASILECNENLETENIEEVTVVGSSDNVRIIVTTNGAVKDGWQTVKSYGV